MHPATMVEQLEKICKDFYSEVQKVFSSEELENMEPTFCLTLANSEKEEIIRVTYEYNFNVFVVEAISEELLDEAREFVIDNWFELFGGKNPWVAADECSESLQSGRLRAELVELDVECESSHFSYAYAKADFEMYSFISLEDYEEMIQKTALVDIDELAVDSSG